MEAQLNTRRDSIEVVALMLIAVLAILTSVSSSTMMFWGALVATFGLFLWYLANRKFWLAAVAGGTFVFTVLVTTSSAF